MGEQERWITVPAHSFSFEKSAAPFVPAVPGSPLPAPYQVELPVLPHRTALDRSPVPELYHSEPQ